MSPHDADSPAKELIMDAGDGISEHNLQNQLAADKNMQGFASMQHRDNDEINTSAHGHNRLKITKLGRAPAANERLHDDNCLAPSTQSTDSRSTPFSSEHHEQEQEILKQNYSVKAQAKAEHAPSAALQTQDAHIDNSTVNEPQDYFATFAQTNHETEGATSTNFTQNGGAYPPTKTAPVLLETGDAQVVAQVPESVRGDPYVLASPAAAVRQQTIHDGFGANREQFIPKQQEGVGTMVEYTGTTQHTVQDDIERDQVDAGTIFGDRQMTDQHLDPNADDEGESEEMEYIQNDSSNESGSEGDGAEDYEDVTAFRAQLKATSAKAASAHRGGHQQLTQEEKDFLHIAGKPNHGHFQDYMQGGHQPQSQVYGAPDSMQQSPVNAHAHAGYGAVSMPTSRHSANARREGGPEMLNYYGSGQYPSTMPSFPPHMSSYGLSSPTGLPAFQGNVQNHRQHALMGYPDVVFPSSPYEEQVLLSAHSSYTTPMYGMPQQAFTSDQPSNYFMNGHHANVQQHKAHKVKAAKESDSTDEDEPLRTRVKRHPSILGGSVSGLPPRRHGVEYDENDCEGGSSDVEHLRTLRKDTETPNNSTKAQKLPPKSVPKPAQRSAPKPATPKQAPSPPKPAANPSGASSIDWTLPKYEATFERGKTKHDLTIAKISIPGLIREEIILSVDHADQEAHLFLNIFLPAQEARCANPDPFPAQAILNFHTIAVMVIEAYAQFEIGDEFGLGRGHWHDGHDKGDEEYARLRDARNADPDEIFFAVIDRWRAGLESGKEGARMIRGAQEFCDVALDVVGFVQENGLLERKGRRQQGDMGMKRGAKKVGDVQGEKAGSGGVKGKAAVKNPTARGKGVRKTGGGEDGKIATTSKGVKRGAKEANTLESRKKAKTTPAKSTPAKAASTVKPRPKKKSDITVLRSIPKK